MNSPDDDRPITSDIRPGIRRVFSLGIKTSDALHDELDEELRLHLEARAAEYRAKGMSAADAEVAARAMFGDGDATRAALHASAGRRERRLRWSGRIEEIRHDARYAVRALRKQPSFTIGVIATLALGLGINSAVFRVADRLFLRPPAGVMRPGELRRLGLLVPGRGGAIAERDRFSYIAARALATAKPFVATAVYTPPLIQRDETGRDVSTTIIGAGYAELLGIRAAKGRFFSAEELRPGAGIGAAVISDAYWRSQFGRDAAVLSRAVTLNGVRYPIVGVAPPGFSGVDPDPVEIWTPLGAGKLGQGEINGVVIPWYETQGLIPLRVLARMRDDATDESAAAAATLATNSPDGSGSSTAATSRLMRERVVVRSLSAPPGNAQSYVTSLRILRQLALVATLILLMAGANAANLLLARALRRRREIAVRLALGISRARLVRQLIVEGCVLGSVAAAFALFTGFWASSALRAVLFPQSRWIDSAFDSRAVVFTIGVSLLTGVIVGAVPAIQSSSPVLSSTLNGTATTGRKDRRARNALVVIQAALSAVLLIGAGFFVQSLRSLTAMDLGMRPDGLVTVDIPLVATGRPLPPGSTDVTTVDEWIARARQIPGVRAAAPASIIPFGSVAMHSISVPGLDSLPEIVGGGPYVTGVSPEYFAVLGMQAIQGRLLRPDDNAGAPRVIAVNATMARILWPGRSAVGQCVRVGGTGRPCAEVVGVVQDIRDRPDGVALARYYVPLEQMSPVTPPAAVIVRTDPALTDGVIASLRRMTFLGNAVRLDPVADRVASGLRPWQTGTVMFTALGTLALLLASVGLASTLAYSFSERRREIGVRLALGADGAAIVRLVVWSGLRLAAIGFGAGLVVALAGSRVLAAVVFGVSLSDPTVYLATALVLLAAAVVASAWPALRARSTDPALVLRID